MEPLPDPSLLPVAQAPPAGGAASTPQRFGQQSPRTAGPQDEDDAAESRAIRKPRTPPLRLGRLLGQQGLDGFPEVVGDKV
jgi:hypothetical protein